MATDSVDSLRAELDALGERREVHDNEDRELAAEIRTAVGKADGRLSKSEIANRLRLHRTTLYRVYK